MHINVPQTQAKGYFFFLLTGSGLEYQLYFFVNISLEFPLVSLQFASITNSDTKKKRISSALFTNMIPVIKALQESWRMSHQPGLHLYSNKQNLADLMNVCTAGYQTN